MSCGVVQLICAQFAAREECWLALLVDEVAHKNACLWKTESLVQNQMRNAHEALFVVDGLARLRMRQESELCEFNPDQVWNKPLCNERMNRLRQLRESKSMSDR